VENPDCISRLQFMGGLVAPLQMGLLYLGGDTAMPTTSPYSALSPGADSVRLQN
jgi:hypothetical protein